jgi:GntR family transcriptional regulator, transcriptional repressor for pyruvate dehydrogenase complex
MDATGDAGHKSGLTGDEAVRLGALSANGHEPFAPLPRRRATTDAIAAIQEQIRGGQLAPGQRLPSERALSEALGVSRPTVREAVQSLAAMNILDVRHGAGIFVSSLGMDELLSPMRFALELSEPTVAQLFEVRLALEPRAAELAAARATEEQIAGIRDCVARFARRGVSREELLELDTELHRRIVEAAGNVLLVNLVASLAALSRRSRELTTKVPGVTKRTRDDHRAIVDAIAAGKAREARRAMERHLVNVRDAALKQRRNAA